MNALERLTQNFGKIAKCNQRMLRCTEILTSAIQRGKRGEGEKFCVTWFTKQEVLELTKIGEEGQDDIRLMER